MAFKKYPQPPFKRFVKCQYGKILEPNYKTANIEPAVYNKKTGLPMFQFGWTITYWAPFKDGSGGITFVDKIVKTADTKEECK